MKKENILKDLKSILQSVVPKMAGAPPPDQYRIWDIWEGVVGPHIAKKAHPEGVRNGVLQVSVVSSVWMQELTFMKQQILERINQTCESSGIKDIRFRLGKISQAMEEADNNQQPALTEEEQKRIERETTAIQDQEVRESLQSLFSTSIKSRRKRGSFR